MRLRRRVLLVSATTFLMAAGVAPPAGADELECSEWNAVTAVGVPDLDGGRGGLELRYGSQHLVWRPPQTRPGDHLGAAVSVLTDTNGDGCLDVAVGAPGADSFVKDSGVVWLLRGSPAGPAEDLRFELPRARSGDQFGFSLSLSTVTLRATDVENPLLVIGAPGRDVGGVTDAGAIAWTRLGTGWEQDLSVVTQDSAGVIGTSERGDRFGEAISSAFSEGPRGYGVMVGSPHEDVGSAKDAGIVERLSLLHDLGTTGSVIYRQVEGGALGAPESGDHFGASLTVTSSALAVGVPGEDTGKAEDAGSINLFSGIPDPGRAFSVSFRPLRAVSQSSRGVPGGVESGDRFGASVLTVDWCAPENNIRVVPGAAPRRSSNVKFAIGAPGEDLGHAADAGTVTLYDSGLVVDPWEGGTPDPPCPSRVIRQDHLARGHAEAGDHVGADLGTRPPLFAPESPGDVLVVAAPGEDVGAATDAGVLELIDLATMHQLPAETFSEGARPGLHYATLH